MSFDACADLVQRADPDRYLSVMAAPPEARDRLFALYAFNVEVSRAPWVTQEPMIAEMRLQWWRDVIEEIGAGGKVRTHEVATPLTELVREFGLDVTRLDTLIEARSHDIYRETFEDLDALWSYIDRTSGHLMVAAAESLAPLGDEFAGLSSYQRTVGIARYLQALPELEARGWVQFSDDVDANALARMGLEHLKAARSKGIDKAHLPAAWAGWWAEDCLRRIAAGRSSDRSPAGRKAALLYRQLFKTF